MSRCVAVSKVFQFRCITQPYRKEELDHCLSENVAGHSKLKYIDHCNLQPFLTLGCQLSFFVGPATETFRDPQTMGYLRCTASQVCRLLYSKVLHMFAECRCLSRGRTRARHMVCIFHLWFLDFLKSRTLPMSGPFLPPPSTIRTAGGHNVLARPKPRVEVRDF